MLTTTTPQVSPHFSTMSTPSSPASADSESSSSKKAIVGSGHQVYEAAKVASLPLETSEVDEDGHFEDFHDQASSKASSVREDRLLALQRSFVGSDILKQFQSGSGCSLFPPQDPFAASLSLGLTGVTAAGLQGGLSPLANSMVAAALFAANHGVNVGPEKQGVEGADNHDILQQNKDIVHHRRTNEDYDNGQQHHECGTRGCDESCGSPVKQSCQMVTASDKISKEQGNDFSPSPHCKLHRFCDIHAFELFSYYQFSA